MGTICSPSRGGTVLSMFHIKNVNQKKVFCQDNDLIFDTSPDSFLNGTVDNIFILFEQPPITDNIFGPVFMKEGVPRRSTV